MRKLVLSLFVLLAGATVQAQESYTIPANAANVTTLAGVIAAKNGDLCNKAGLPRTCTQAQLCTAKGVPGGASCTAAQARNAGQRIFPATQAGREEFTTHAIAAPKFQELVAEVAEDQKRDFCERWTAATQTVKNNTCTALGAPAGCDPGCGL